MSWQDGYRAKCVTPEEALQVVSSGMRVYIHPGCAEPEALVEALMAQAPRLHDVEVVHIMTLGRADYVAPEMAGHFRHNAMFIGANVREAVNEGRADYTPIFLSEIESLFESGQMPIAAKNGTVSRIAPILAAGADVVTSRGLTCYIVTEYGVAYLHGKTIRQRAEALIEIAHPKFREELYEYCERTRWLERSLPLAHRG